MSISNMIADAVLQTRSFGIVAADREGIINFWNRGAERIFGYVNASAIGRSLDIIVPEQLRSRHWEGYRRVMAGGESRYGDGAVLAVPAMRQDGERISIEFSIVALRNGTRDLIGLVAIIRDVTEQFNEIRALREKAFP